MKICWERFQNIIFLYIKICRERSQNVYIKICRKRSQNVYIKICRKRSQSKMALEDGWSLIRDIFHQWVSLCSILVVLCSATSLQSPATHCTIM